MTTMEKDTDIAQLIRNMGDKGDRVIFHVPSGATLPKSPTFKVGDGVSYRIGSDAYPATVRRVTPGGKSLWVSKDKVRAGRGRKLFIPCEVHPREWAQFTLRENGEYRLVGKSFGYLTPGRDSHRDPSF